MKNPIIRKTIREKANEPARVYTILLPESIRQLAEKLAAESGTSLAVIFINGIKIQAEKEEKEAS